MTKISLIKKLPGIPADKMIVREIVDEKIISYPYALRIADYILDSQGRAWWAAQGTMAATELLSRFDVVSFFTDAKRYEGFLPVQPVLNYNISQGQVAMIWNVTIWFLKDKT